MGRGVGLDRCEVLGGEGRFVVASDGMEVRIAEQRTTEPVNESIPQVGPVEGCDRWHRRRGVGGTRRGAWLDRRAGSGGPIAEIPVAPGLGAGLRPAPLHATRSGRSSTAESARGMPFIMRLTRNGPMGFRGQSRELVRSSR